MTNRKRKALENMSKDELIKIIEKMAEEKHELRTKLHNIGKIIADN